MDQQKRQLGAAYCKGRNGKDGVKVVAGERSLQGQMVRILAEVKRKTKVPQNIFRKLAPEKQK